MQPILLPFISAFWGYKKNRPLTPPVPAMGRKNDKQERKGMMAYVCPCFFIYQTALQSVFTDSVSIEEFSPYSQFQ
jgi:hypothetical protein